MHTTSTQKPNQINQINQKLDINQIAEKVDYDEARSTVQSIPFETESEHFALLCWHLQRVGKERFAELVQRAKGADLPGRYLLRCLKREKVTNGNAFPKSSQFNGASHNVYPPIHVKNKMTSVNK